MFLQFSFRMPCFPWFSMGFPCLSQAFWSRSPTQHGEAPSLEASWLVAQVQEARAQRRAWRGLCPWQRLDLRRKMLR
jgi:hypothetical protein